MVSGSTILDIIFPVKCILCKKRGYELCPDCLAFAPEAERETANWIFSLYDYRHPPIKKLIWLLKYSGKKKIAEAFAKILFPKIQEELSDLARLDNFKNPILIPVPLSAKRLRERGFNQSLLLCKGIMKMDKENKFILEKEILIKKEDKEHQAKIRERNKRIKNIVGSFGVKNPEKIKGRNVVLIDDVTTTGATLAEAKKVLKNAGARKIIAFTIAH